ncbi:hypothetical protein [Rhodoblastus sp.]|uniref:hypothetical protein n=1 Tax=Rhodoblastus sp. TaxID=1962975 RepID=UPI00262A42E8|nr:hypothetical protein [Rhodoblastus sp.]
MFGLAVGDALGTTIEFSRRDSYEPVTGQIAGAVWGYSSIPAHWRSRLAWSDRILALAEDLMSLQ